MKLDIKYYVIFNNKVFMIKFIFLMNNHKTQLIFIFFLLVFPERVKEWKKFM